MCVCVCVFVCVWSKVRTCSKLIAFNVRKQMVVLIRVWDKIAQRRELATFVSGRRLTQLEEARTARSKLQG